MSKAEKRTPFQKFFDWVKDVNTERKLKKRYKKRVKELKKKDPYTYD